MKLVTNGPPYQFPVQATHNLLGIQQHHTAIRDLARGRPQPFLVAF